MPHRLTTALILSALALSAHAAPRCDIRSQAARVVDTDTLNLA
ncbi:MAG: hypothetical protein U5S82_03630 [Gammaproteobacteria bacterium]|nr:hypothetical protein [Gammaproteobacteria bacterium]